MPFLFWDPTFLMLIPTMIFAFWAQSRVQGTYRKMSKVPAANGLTGHDTNVEYANGCALGAGLPWPAHRCLPSASPQAHGIVPGGAAQSGKLS